ncbi:MAG: CvpA family protein [Bacillota bacterium]|nr:CvpA family protein [Bacillota bacterium]
MTLDSNLFLVYNAAIVIVSALMIFFAYKRGFVRQLLNIAALVGSVYISIIACEILAPKFSLINTFFAKYMVEITKVFGGLSTFAKLESSVNICLWFVLLLVGLRIFFWIVILLIPKYRKKDVLSFVNHFFGMILGFVKVFVVLVLLTVILNLPIFTNGSEFVQSGVLLPVSKGIEKVVENVK